MGQRRGMMRGVVLALLLVACGQQEPEETMEIPPTTEGSGDLLGLCEPEFVNCLEEASGETPYIRKYNSCGQIERYDFYWGGGAVLYYYDELGRLSNIRGDVWTYYYFEGDTNRLTMMVEAGPYDSQREVLYFYDPSGRLIRTEDRAVGDGLFLFTDYLYDSSGRLVRKSNSNEEYEDYRYDEELNQRTTYRYFGAVFYDQTQIYSVVDERFDEEGLLVYYYDRNSRYLQEWEYQGQRVMSSTIDEDGDGETDFFEEHTWQCPEGDER